MGNRARSVYLEGRADPGIAGGLCCVWFRSVLHFDSLRRLSQPVGAFASTVQLAALIACLGFLTHSLVDFNLHIPGNALLFFLMANLAATEIRQPTQQVPNSEIARHRPRIH